MKVGSGVRLRDPMIVRDCGVGFVVIDASSLTYRLFPTVVRHSYAPEVLCGNKMFAASLVMNAVLVFQIFSWGTCAKVELQYDVAAATGEAITDVVVMAGLMPTKKLTTKMEPNSLGNNMFVFQSLLGIAKSNHLRPVFARDDLQDLNRTFALDHSRFDIKSSEAYEDGGNFDHFEALPSLRRNVNTRIGRYLQNIEYFLPLKQSLRSFWTLRPRHVRAARRLLPASNSVCVHRRYFPAKHLENKEHVCPTSDALQQLLTRLSAGKTVVVFSNDIARAKAEIAATSIQFVDPGATNLFQSGDRDRAEVLPIDADLVARDFAALTICDDLVVTCGTFGGFAGVLHSGKGSVYYFSDQMLTAGHNNRTYGTRALSKWKLSTSRR